MPTLRTDIRCCVAIGLLAVAVASRGPATVHPTGAAVAQSPRPPEIAGCAILPADNIWNARVDGLPVDPRSAAYVASIGADRPVHPDFGSGLYNGAPIGIPYVTVPGDQARVPVSFTYADESDPGPYPVPVDAPIEGGPSSDGDRHILVVDRDDCVLYELYAAYPNGDGTWRAGSGAIFDLGSNALRPDTWTSADAAGLPILPGLVRHDEVAAGEIRHAVRFTVPRTRRAYVWPGRHHASALADASLPPMGQRFRLKASFDVSGFSPPVQVILRALQRYGMILADNGSAWFISGAPDDGWDNDMLVGELRRVHGGDFEAVDSTSLMADPNSGRVRGGATATEAASPTVTSNPTVASSPTVTPSPPSPLTGTPTPSSTATNGPPATGAPGTATATIPPDGRPLLYLPQAARHR
jgi:hypothetical protein